VRFFEVFLIFGFPLNIYLSVYSPIITIGLEILEGKDILAQTKELSDQIGVNSTKLNKICLAVSTLLW
jgi:hypothetical protein